MSNTSIGLRWEPSNWKEVIDTANLSPDKEMDLVSKWLIITRAAVFTMTATSGLIGGLLAAAMVDNPNWVNFTLSFFGLLIAHAANNMNNDYFDMEAGIDEYGLTKDARHPARDVKWNLECELRNLRAYMKELGLR